MQRLLEERDKALPELRQAFDASKFKPCLVCGDLATGHKYGVYTCCGCTSFFQRSLRKWTRFSCQSSKDCMVTRNNRRNCQYCRFQKCVRIGMKSQSLDEEFKRDKNLAAAHSNIIEDTEDENEEIIVNMEFDINNDMDTYSQHSDWSGQSKDKDALSIEMRPEEEVRTVGVGLNMDNNEASSVNAGSDKVVNVKTEGTLSIVENSKLSELENRSLRTSLWEKREDLNIGDTNGSNWLDEGNIISEPEFQNNSENFNSEKNLQTHSVDTESEYGSYIYVIKNDSAIEQCDGQIPEENCGIHEDSITATGQSTFQVTIKTEPVDTEDWSLPEYITMGNGHNEIPPPFCPVIIKTEMLAVEPAYSRSEISTNSVNSSHDTRTIQEKNSVDEDNPVTTNDVKLECNTDEIFPKALSLPVSLDLISSKTEPVSEMQNEEFDEQTIAFQTQGIREQDFSDTVRNAGSYCYICRKSFRFIKQHMQTHQQRCYICNRFFKFSQNFKIHLQSHDLKTHLSSLPNVCIICFKTMSKKRLRIHINRHKLFPYQCTRCDQLFESANILDNHNNDCKKKKPLICYICLRGFAHETSLKLHINHVHAAKCPCLICGKEFSSKSKVIGHFKQAHMAVNPLKCPVCSETFKNIDSIQDHLDAHNTTQDSVSCELCSQSLHLSEYETHIQSHRCNACLQCFMSIETVQNHAQFCKETAKNWNCKTCKKWFRTKKLLACHRATHRKLKFKCSICSKEVSTRASLHVHMHTHKNSFPAGCSLCRERENRWPHYCCTCGLTFPTRQELNIHSLIHYQTCNVCNKALKTPKALEKHMLLHASYKLRNPYSCELCNKRYRKFKLFKVHKCKKRLHEKYKGITEEPVGASLQQTTTASSIQRLETCDKDSLKVCAANQTSIGSPVPLTENESIFKTRSPNKSLPYTAINKSISQSCIFSVKQETSQTEICRQPEQLKEINTNLINSEPGSDSMLTNGHDTQKEVSIGGQDLHKEFLISGQGVNKDVITKELTDGNSLNESRHQCKICSKKFKYPLELKNHLKTHLNMKKNMKSFFKC